MFYCWHCLFILETFFTCLFQGHFSNCSRLTCCLIEKDILIQLISFLKNEEK